MGINSSVCETRFRRLGPLKSVGLQYLVSGILGLLTAHFCGQLRLSELSYFKNREFYFRTLLFVAYTSLLYFAIDTASRDKLPVVTLLNYLWPTLTMVLSVALISQPYRPVLLVAGSAIVVCGLALEIV